MYTKLIIPELTNLATPGMLIDSNESIVKNDISFNAVQI
jgi:hypothetical protein